MLGSLLLPSDLDEEYSVTSDREAASKLNNIFPVASAYQLITMSLESYSGGEHGEGTDRGMGSIFRP